MLVLETHRVQELVPDDTAPIRRALRREAAEIEAAVIAQLRTLTCTPEIIVRTWKRARQQDVCVTEVQVRTALTEFTSPWKELFPAEQTRLINLLIARIEIKPDGLDINLRIEGLASLARELRGKAAA